MANICSGGRGCPFPRYRNPSEEPAQLRGFLGRVPKLSKRVQLAPGLFHQGPLDMVHELVGVGPVDESMVVSDGKKRHGLDSDRVVAFVVDVDHRPLFDRADTQNANLGLIDDRCAKQRAEHARICDSKCTPLDFFRAQPLFASTV